MKICHVITRLIVGGAQENTLATCIGLLRRGYEVDLVLGPQTGPEGSLYEQAEAAEVPMITIDALRRAPYPLLDLRAGRALARLFRERRYDVVHTHSGKAGFLGRLAARLAGVPVIVHTIHGPSFYRYQNPVGNWLFTWAERLAGEVTTQFVSVADAMSDQYLAAGISDPSRYVTIHSGMNVTAFAQATLEPALAASLGIEPGDLVVGKVARLFRLKGHEYLFEAARRIVAAEPRVKFLLVGDGRYRQRYEEWADRLGLRDHFIFTGLVPPTEIPRYLALMDILVHLSLREGLPRTLPQALASGKPVIAFDVDGAREVCLPERTGILLPAGDVAGLVAGVSRLLHDPAARHRMGRQGRDFVLEQFTEDRMVDRIDELYRRLAVGPAVIMHWLLAYFYIFDFSFVLALLLTPAFRQVSFRTGFVDHPNLDRKIHRDPMPLLGGVAVFLAFAGNVLLNYFIGLPLVNHWTSSLASWPDFGIHVEGAFSVAPRLAVIVVGGALMVGLGAYDDRHHLKAWPKLAGQLAIALLVAAAGMRITLFITNPVISYVITVLWIVTMTNALNYLDNMDGLCAGVGLVCAGLFGFIAAVQEQYFVCLLAAAFAGSLLGFLPYNFKPARIFLGDAGSHLVGYLLAILAILGSFYTADAPTWLPVLIPLLVLAVPLFDLVMVSWIRWRNGAPVYIGDVNHLSHRLVKLGLPQSWAVALIYLITLTLGLGATILLWSEMIGVIIVMVQAVCILAIITLLEQLGKK